MRHILETQAITIQRSDYLNNVELHIAIEQGSEPLLSQIIQEKSAGKAHLKINLECEEVESTLH